MTENESPANKLNRIFDAWRVEAPATPADHAVNGTLRGLRIEVMRALDLPVAR